MTNQSLESGDLRVVFVWSTDRFAHRVERRIDGCWRPMVESIEGSSDEAWPPSPTLQSLHIENRSSGSVALLVGKGGTSHWSASIEPIAAQASFQFDIACRVNTPPKWIGNNYRTMDRSGTPSVRIEAVGTDTICRQTAAVYRIQPRATAPACPSTFRWRYEIAANTSAGSPSLNATH